MRWPRPRTFVGCLISAITLYAAGFVEQLLYVVATEENWGDQALPIVLRGSVAVVGLLSMAERDRYRKAVAWLLLLLAFAGLGGVAVVTRLGDFPVWLMAIDAVGCAAMAYFALWAIRLAGSEVAESAQQQAERLAVTRAKHEEMVREAYAGMGRRAGSRSAGHDQGDARSDGATR